MFNYLKNSRQKQFIFLFTIFLILYFSIPENENSFLWRLPPLLKGLPLMFNVLLDNLMFNWFTVPVWDDDWQMYEDKTLFRIITRSISNSVLFFIIFIREIFLGGFQTVNAILGDGITDKYTWISIPALPWTAVVIGAIIIGYKLEGIRLALLAGIGFFYVSVFGQWEPSMQTLSLVLFTAPVCFIIGLSLGVWGYLSKRVEVILQPILNVAQTMPHFSYLVPIVVLFGVGDHAGSIATIIFATPPMVTTYYIRIKKNFTRSD